MSSSFLAQVNRTKVPADVLALMLERHADMEADRRGVFESRAFELFELLKERGYSGKRHSDLALAITFRLEALARIVAGDEARGWTLPGTERGQTFVHADLLRAAVEEPLIEGTEHRVTFNPDSFRERVLRHAKAEGRA